MILTSLIITDFGVFRGRQAVSLESQRGRPIVLFGGKNGAGKSTVLEAIRLCLYGQAALGSRTARETYLKYLDAKIHTNPGFLIQPTFASIALEFQYADAHVIHTYRVTRSWERRGAHRLVEHFDLERDGKALEEIDEEHRQDFVRDLIPLGVSELFFFDGEKIQQLADDASDQDALADAIKSLLGLDLVEKLQTDLGIYASRVSLPKGSARDEECEALENEIVVSERNLEELRSARRLADASLSELRISIARVESRVVSEGGSFARGREKLLEERARLKALISQHEDSLRQLCLGLLPFALVPKLCAQLKDQLLLEDRTARAEAGQEVLRAGIERLIGHVSSSEFWSKVGGVTARHRREILENIGQLGDDVLREQENERIPMVHRLSVPVQQQLLTWIDQATTDVRATLRTLGDDLEKLYRDIHRAEEKLRRIPADDILQPLMKELHELHAQLAQSGKKILGLDEEIGAADAKITQMRRRYDQLAQEIARDADQVNKRQAVHKIQAVLDEYRTRLLEQKVSDLQTAVSDCFNRLCRKTDSLRRIAIDPRDFSVSLYGKQDRPLPKAQLSAGEKQIYAISMLWALAKTSGRPLPMIIDTPLARLDSDHRRLLLTAYFPHASHQVIILSTDTEVDRSYFAGLRPSVARAYCLDFDLAEHSTRIVSGYFWPSDETD